MYTMTMTNELMYSETIVRYKKLRSSIKYFMLGRGYHVALKAMRIGLEHHIGTRKDGVTPEFQHQIEQANKARTLIDAFLFPEETLATIFLHDVVEDNGGPEGKKIPLATIHSEFGPRIANAVWLMTNQYKDGTKKQKTAYYEEMIKDPIASLCKGFDRDHNQNSMVGVFSHEKQKRYIEETEKYILPMLKRAREIHTQQEPAYQNIKWQLVQQIRLLRAVHEAATTASNT